MAAATSGAWGSSFWKSRIEPTENADAAFPVGVLYGPSGCGKSSLVAAGLLPQLAESVLVCRVLCTPEDTERDLRAALRKRFPAMGEAAGLPEMLSVLRENPLVRGPQRKLLIVLDQFEQWLHGWQSDPRSPLLAAIRHCDGAFVQGLLVVRADFVHSLACFMRQVEVPLREGYNAAAVDMFDRQHARHVLELFGRAYGKLSGPLGDAENRFLRQLVDELSQDRKVICVRLALTAEMMKHRDWTLAEWKSVGRAEGVGEAYLEETFNGPSAAPTHRQHRQAAQRVLAALLPAPGVEIRGPTSSHTELLRAAEYQHRPRDFRELMSLLQDEVRVITPVESPLGGADVANPAAASPDQPEAARSYRLIHDYHLSGRVAISWSTAVLSPRLGSLRPGDACRPARGLSLVPCPCKTTGRARRDWPARDSR